MIFFSKRKVLRFFSPVFVAAIVFVPAVLTAGEGSGPIEDPLGATFVNNNESELQPNLDGSKLNGTEGSRQGELQSQTEIPNLSGSLTKTDLKLKALPLDSTSLPPRGSNKEPQDFNRSSANQPTLFERIQNQNGAIQKNNTVSQINTQKNNAINQQNQLNNN